MSRWLMRERLKVLMEENERISVELANAMAGNVLVRDTIRDSVQVVSAPVVVVGSKSYKKEVADKELLKDLGLKPPQVEEQQTTVTVIHDYILFIEQSSVRIVIDNLHPIPFRSPSPPQKPVFVVAMDDGGDGVAYRVG